MHIELFELNVFIGWTLTCIWPQRFKRFALVSPSDLKKCSFVWHLKRFGVLLGGTCETLRLVCPCWLDTCKSIWTQWSLLVPLLLYHKSNCLFTQYKMYYRNTRYLVAEHSPVYFHEHVTTSLDIHRCYIIGNPLQIWDFWQLANKLNFSCSPWIMHALF